MPITSVKQLNIFGGEPTEITTASPESTGKLNAPARHLARLLIMPGHYMRLRKCEDGNNYMVYHGNQSPVRYFAKEVGEIF